MYINKFYKRILLACDIRLSTAVQWPHRCKCQYTKSNAKKKPQRGI